MIGVIRHGRTNWNEKGRLQGLTDIPLNEEGRKQAERLATRFHEEKWDLIVSSPLSRAYDTANAVAKRLNIPLITDERLVERGFGKAEGTTEEKRVRLWGKDWRSLELGIEPQEVVMQRSLECVEEMSSEHQGKGVLFVSHGNTINQLVKGLLKDPSFDEKLNNTSVSLFRKEEDGWVCKLLNCTKHLEVVETNASTH
ncbi:histidine phosphatase family protein [Salinibacillus xinjiangensis]|nr:histidine phosphatase family protein [Salinibacillus xinjiangensis]